MTRFEMCLFHAHPQPNIKNSLNSQPARTAVVKISSIQFLLSFEKFVLTIVFVFFRRKHGANKTNGTKVNK